MAHEADTFGQRLAQERKQMHLTQGQLAAALGVKKRSVQNWEQDSRGGPSGDAPWRLYHVLGATAWLRLRPETQTSVMAGDVEDEDATVVVARGTPTERFLELVRKAEELAPRG